MRVRTRSIRRSHACLGADLVGTGTAETYRRRHAIPHLLAAGCTDLAESALSELPTYLDRFHLAAADALDTLGRDLFATARHTDRDTLAPWNDWLRRNGSLFGLAQSPEEAVGMLSQTAVEHGADSPVSASASRWFGGPGKDRWHFRNAQVPRSWRSASPIERTFDVGGPVRGSLKAVSSRTLAALREDGALVVFDVRTGERTSVDDAGLIALEVGPAGDILGLSSRMELVRFRGPTLARERVATVDFRASCLSVVGRDVLVAGAGLARVGPDGEVTRLATSLTEITSVAALDEARAIVWNSFGFEGFDMPSGQRVFSHIIPPSPPWRSPHPCVRAKRHVVANDPLPMALLQVLPLGDGGFVALVGPRDADPDPDNDSDPESQDAWFWHEASKAYRLGRRRPDLDPSDKPFVSLTPDWQTSWTVYDAHGEARQRASFDTEAFRPLHLATRAAGGLWVALADTWNVGHSEVEGRILVQARALDGSELPGASAVVEGDARLSVASLCETRMGRLATALRGWAHPFIDEHALNPHPQCVAGASVCGDGFVSWDTSGVAFLWNARAAAAQGAGAPHWQWAGQRALFESKEISRGMSSPMGMVAFNFDVDLCSLGTLRTQAGPSGTSLISECDVSVAAAYFHRDGTVATDLNPDGVLRLGHPQGQHYARAELYLGNQRAALDDLLTHRGEDPIAVAKAVARAGTAFEGSRFYAGPVGTKVFATLTPSEEKLLRFRARITTEHAPVSLEADPERVGAERLETSLAVVRLEAKAFDFALVHLERAVDIMHELLAAGVAYTPYGRHLAAVLLGAGELFHEEGRQTEAEVLRNLAQETSSRVEGVLDAQEAAREARDAAANAGMSDSEGPMRARIKEIEAKALRRMRSPLGAWELLVFRHMRPTIDEQ